MASTEYMRLYMREFREGRRRGWRKMIPGSRNWLKARRLALDLVGKRIFSFTKDVAELGAKHEDPIGPQVIPDGMTTCPRCDILTRRRDSCGFCAAEKLREGAMAA